MRPSPSTSLPLRICRGAVLHEWQANGRERRCTTRLRKIHQQANDFAQLFGGGSLFGGSKGGSRDAGGLDEEGGGGGGGGLVCRKQKEEKKESPR